jgi:hypothetical protein
LLYSFELLNGAPDFKRRLAMHITGDKTLLIEHENDGLGFLISSENKCNCIGEFSEDV